MSRRDRMGDSRVYAYLEGFMDEYFFRKSDLLDIDFRKGREDIGSPSFLEE